MFNICCLLVTSSETVSYKETDSPKVCKKISDSQAAIAALNNQRITSKCVANALETIELLASRVVVHLQLVWIKARDNIEGNEEADKAAKVWKMSCQF